jgi:drug/metabolite transporter (DMT)-like permease
MKYYIYIISAAFIFGSSGVFIKTLNLPVSTLTFFRMAIPFGLMTVLFLFRRKPFPSIADKTMLLASFLNATRLFFYFAGYTYGNISTTVILLYTWPVFATIWSALFLGEPLTFFRWICFLTTLAGVILINLNQAMSLGDQQFTGVLFILSSAFIYSMTVVMFKKKSQCYTPFETLWFQNGLGAFLFLPFLVINRPLPVPWQTGTAILYAFLIGVVGFGLFFSGLRRIDASKASFLTYVEVVSGIFFGVAFFGETLSWNILAGGSLVLVSALLLSRPE